MYKDNSPVFIIPSSVYSFTDDELYILRQDNPALIIERDERSNLVIMPLLDQHPEL